jgi:1-aminocyclopropane-1-carboxylate deaminase/D-cysteine desulfhydrase-like pyridoxal-dependent ACC family enzyme
VLREIAERGGKPYAIPAGDSTSGTTRGPTAPDESTLDAIRLAARIEGLITDPVYEGKSMADLIDMVSRGEISPQSTVLYAHLGGQPALNGYSALFS